MHPRAGVSALHCPVEPSVGETAEFPLPGFSSPWFLSRYSHVGGELCLGHLHSEITIKASERRGLQGSNFHSLLIWTGLYLWHGLVGQ